MDRTILWSRSTDLVSATSRIGMVIHPVAGDRGLLQNLAVFVVGRHVEACSSFLVRHLRSFSPSRSCHQPYCLKQATDGNSASRITAEVWVNVMRYSASLPAPSPLFLRSWCFSERLALARVTSPDPANPDASSYASFVERPEFRDSRHVQSCSAARSTFPEHMP